MPLNFKMERNCDSNQNLCDNSNENYDEKKILCDEKQENPSNLVQTFSAILPSNFLNLSPRFVRIVGIISATYLFLRWRDWFMRGQSGLLLMTSFYFLVKVGPVGLFSLTLIVQVESYYYEFIDW